MRRCKKKKKREVLCKRCEITFNQISGASSIACLMEIMSHLTSAGTPATIRRTSRRALHIGGLLRLAG